jgi:hypothetical protein
MIYPTLFDDFESAVIPNEKVISQNTDIDTDEQKLLERKST